MDGIFFSIFTPVVVFYLIASIRILLPVLLSRGCPEHGTLEEIPSHRVEGG